MRTTGPVRAMLQQPTARGIADQIVRIVEKSGSDTRLGDDLGRVRAKLAQQHRNGPGAADAHGRRIRIAAPQSRCCAA